MKKSFSNKFKLFGLIAMCFSFIALSIMAVIPSLSPMASAADMEKFMNTLGTSLTVTAKTSTHTIAVGNEESALITGGYTTGISRNNSYAWKDVKYFEISRPDISGLAESSSYQYSYKVTWIPSVLDDSNELNYATYAAQPTKTIYSSTATSKELVKNKVYFFIDENIDRYAPTDFNVADYTDKGNPDASELFTPTEDAVEDIYNIQGGWGTYIFTFEINTKETSGNAMFELKPTSLSELSDKVLSISAEKSTPGVNSINDGWIFSVNEDFRYVNRKNIIWSITGTGSDGTKYVLREQDKTAENETLIGQNLPYQGATIKLDTEIQGNWIATASISEEGVTTKTASSEEVSTIKPFSTTAIIWIVTGVTVVSVAIVAIIISVNIRKEKTW